MNNIFKENTLNLEYLWVSTPNIRCPQKLDFLDLESDEPLLFAMIQISIKNEIIPETLTTFQRFPKHVSTIDGQQK